MGQVLKVTGVVLLVAAVAGGVAYALQRNGDEAGATDDLPAELATAEVIRRDLVTYEEATATLGFTTSVTVSAPVAGTVTDIVDSGDSVEAGTVLGTIDGAPLVALVGDVPGYRDLSEDAAAGADVRQLEQNLVWLGFDPDGAITIDEEFDEATADAVTAWENSLGQEGDGEVPASQIVFVPGRLLVDEVAATIGGGITSGGALFTARQTERQFLVSDTVGDGGTVTGFAAPGTPAETGLVLFRGDGVPVVAVEGDAAALAALARDLTLGVDDGADVELLERMLAAGGFADEALTVDDHFDEATASAVAAWQDAHDVVRAADAAVVFPAGGYVVVPSALVVGRPLVADGTVLGTEAPVLVLTTAARAVTTTAPIGDSTFALGATIDVEFPDGTVSPGTVVEVGNVATNPTGVPGETPSVEITLCVEAIPASVDSFVQIPVTLRVVDESVPDAFVVPVSALLALAEGGYALEVVDGTNTESTNTGGPFATHLIAVETGLFTDGFVEVTGADLAEGLTVVVPA